MSATTRLERWTAVAPCPVCGGHDRLARGTGQRCSGFLGGGGRVANCSREEQAGLLPLDERLQPPAFAHFLCRTCGTERRVHHDQDAGPDHDICRCTAAAHVAASFRQNREQARRGKDNASSDQNRQIVHRYPYHAADGTLRYWTLRYQPKAFLPLRPGAAEHDCDGPRGCGCRHEGSHRMVSGDQRVEPVPYRLPELLADTKRMLLLVEGERDADSCRDTLGLPATTAAGWCDWTADQARMIPSSRIPIIIPDQGDPDGAGLRRARRAHAALREAGFAPRLLLLPGPGEHDVSDWLAAGHGREELVALAKQAPAWDGSDWLEHVPPPPGGGGNGHGNGGGANGHGPAAERLGPFTDTRNAQRFVAAFGEGVRHDFTRGYWRLWRDGVWQLDQTEEVMRLAKEVVRRLPEEIDPELPADTRQRMQAQALACESTGRLRALLGNAQAELGVTHERWDQDAYLLNCRNGTVDLRTGALLEHRPERWCTKQAPVDYDPAAPCPRWQAFLERIFAGDQALIAYLQRAVGLSLVGEVVEHVLFVCYGSGSNGKSTALNTLVALLGDYARTADPNLLIEQRNPQHPTNVAELRGVRLAAMAEPEGRFNAAMVKALTGGDPRNARFLFQDAFTYLPSDTAWLTTNHKPLINEHSEGIWRRVKLLPFEVQIPPAEQDHHLQERLREEFSGILAWVVRDCLEWQQAGLGEAPAVARATARYRAEMDVMAAFLLDECELEAGAEVGAAELYSRYGEWCERNGERAVGQRFFGLRLGERGLESVRSGHTNRSHWRGLRLRTGGLPPAAPLFRP